MWCKDFDIFQVWRTGENFSLQQRLKATEDLKLAKEVGSKKYGDKIRKDES